MEYLQKHISLVLGLAIPILVVALTFIIVAFPQLFAKETPQFDFVYAAGDQIVFPDMVRTYPDMAYPIKSAQSGIPKYTYQVVEGKIVQVNTSTSTLIDFPGAVFIEPTVRFYLHHVIANTSVPITPQDAMQYKLNTSKIAPDGFEFIHGRTYGSVFPFFYNSEDGYKHVYVKKGPVVKEMRLNLIDEDYYQDFFVGWIVQ